MAENIGSSVGESSEKILLLLENMLTYVKSQVSGGPVAFEAVAVHTLVNDVAVIFRDGFVLRQNTFVNNVPETLVVRSNGQLLKIILHNLIDNANKFTRHGSISVNAGQDGGAMTLLVSDTGAGLPKRVRGWFNEAGAAYPESPDGIQGTNGIGLVIVKELADLLKLQLRANSGPGAEFLIKFVEI